MSLAYLDPGNLEADLQMGAYSGSQLIWVLLWSTVMGLFLQLLAARLGVSSGRNLAQTCRAEYPRWVAYTLWGMTEVAIIASDIQEIVGTAIAFRILFGFPLWGGALLTGLDTFTFLGLHYFGIRRLEAFICCLILVMACCFAINFFASAPAMGEMLHGAIVPDVPSYGRSIAVGTLGSVIMPHNIYLHSALVQSRRVNHDDSLQVRTANKYFAIEAAAALLASFFINLFVVGCFSEAFFDKRCAEASGGPYALLALGAAAASHHNRNSCQAGPLAKHQVCCGTIGLAQSQYALVETLGDSAKYIWAVGLLAAGQASTMTGVIAGQCVMEGKAICTIATSPCSHHTPPWVSPGYIESSDALTTVHRVI